MAIKTLTKEQRKRILNDKEFRVRFCKRSFFHFISYYLRHKFTLPPANFHFDLIQSLETVDDVNKYLAVLGFRGSAKSTILEAFAIWSLVNGKHNFIVYIGNTMDDSKMSLANIRNEIEENQDLQTDFNIILEHKKKPDFREKWSDGQLTIKNCTIIAKSREQKIRGVKYKDYRIDLIIGDDLEDVKDADTVEKRKKTRQWFFTEVLPATKQGSQADNVKVVLIGNLVHRDCLIAHLSKGKIVKTLWFPLIDDNGEIAWKGLYPDMEAVEKEKEKVMLAGEGMGHIIWAREYLLKTVDEEDAIITLTDIQYYPDEWLQKQFLSAGVGVDFAISKKQTADYTAMVKAVEVKNEEGEKRLLIMKNPIKGRFGFEETIQKAVEINELMPVGVKFYPEDQNYQKSAIEIMERNGLNVVPMKAVGDKRSRLVSACFYIKTGRVLFPKEGAEELIENIIGFGIEDHDDLADAMAYVIMGMVKKKSGLILG